MKKYFITAFFYFYSFTSSAAVAELRFSQEFIFSKVLEIMNKEPIKISVPEVRFASQATLKDFQDDVENQWGFRPNVVTNVYAAAANRIYLYDDTEYYKKTGRCMDDSLAHEYVHFVQVHYMKIPIEQFDDSMEWQAVDVQTLFRERYCHKIVIL